MNSTLKRAILGVYFVFIIIFTMAIMLLIVMPDSFESISTYISSNLLGNNIFQFVVFFGGLAILAITVILLLSGTSDDTDKRTVSKKTEIGEIKVSLNSIESIALAATKRLSGIKEAKAHVYKGVEGVTVIIKAIVLADVNIPILSEDIQVKVKKTIEDTSGIRVLEVKVVVDNIFVGYNKNRVE
ncbi:MAG TPA: alkaline shock response membrane anchor protein AmaP [Pseudobacteroides sp.]|uniref:alkaline shock response membrane anchor protein AmaP n=1 Tax=Pseudobacteroides sp. TaxID=1968840 RepID=UPI002F9325A1